jgi:hypothetical protein
MMEEYRRQLHDAGFSAVEVIDSGADLNAYAKVENQACCCPPTSSGLPVVDGGQCSNSGETLHAKLLDLLTRYNVNEYAASVRVFGLKT